MYCGTTSCPAIRLRTARATRAAPGKGVARSTAGSTASGLPRRLTQVSAATATAARASSCSACAPSAARARVKALLDISGGAGPLADQREADLRAGRQVAGAQAAVPVDDRQLGLRAAGHLGERDGELG